MEQTTSPPHIAAGVQTQSASSEDPLIAALPPNTDYITYLTLLEYQLTPKNLPTLNHLLQDDDGTLAAEIGWDLVKLVLPILRVDPDSARQCLDIVARRGNPREVIVRVAEELESLGQHEDEEGDEADPSERDDGLPTFGGEAPRVHLGDMTLQGMPPQEDRSNPAQQSEHANIELDTTLDELKLQIFLSMLSTLHPRIKTQYPSRFLATSLPAALGAYRRLSMSSESTLAFLNTLTNLAGKKRPALPPRVSTSDILTTSAPLPDPESKKDSSTSTKESAVGEAEIILRLLQAVLLEVIEEYTIASSEVYSPLAAQLRLHFEPNSLPSFRKAELQALTNTTEAKEAEIVRQKFLSIARDLKIDIASEVSVLSKPTPEPPAQDDEEQYEYPTSPSQIPFAPTGLLLLYAAQLYTQTMAQTSQSMPSPELQSTLQVIDQQFETDPRLRFSPAAIDSVLSILYLLFCLPSPTAQPTTSASDPTPPTPTPLTRTETVLESQTLLLATHTMLRDIFTTTPSAPLRDTAHHIATHILHSHSQRDTRLHIIRILLETDPAQAPSPIHEAQCGNLKAIGVDWLMDELAPTPTVSEMMGKLEPASMRGLKLSDLGPELVSPLIPSAETVDAPPALGVTGQQKELAAEAFAAQLPFYIAMLNFLWMVGRSDEGPLASGTGSDSGSADVRASVLERGGALLGKLRLWRDYLSAKVTAAKPVATAVPAASAGAEGGDTDAGLEIDGIALPDVFAFEDVVGRVVEVWQEKQGE